MRIAIPKEITPNENRVGLVPLLVNEYKQLGCTLLFEKNAGTAANYPDHHYENVEFHDNAQSLHQNADIILKVQPPLEQEILHYKKNTIVISFALPDRFPERTRAMRDQIITSFAMELIPRITRAQTMDALSSQATIMGYKAALIAANLSNRLFPMLTTAAGTIRPANVLVIGAGVAGLQAIATSRRLGAIVKAYDVRSAAREQIESLGASMINIDVKAEGTGGYARELTVEEQQIQQTALTEAIANADVVISTALIPGKPAPKIISQAMVEKMIPGSVIVDAAAESGGNCMLTQPGQSIDHAGVTIYGPTNLPSMASSDASKMYAKNLLSFVKLLIQDGKLNINWEDNILQQSILTHAGEIKHQSTRNLIEGANK